MSSFNGVTVVTDGKHCTTSTVDDGNGMAESAYHLFLVKDYSRTLQDIPNGRVLRSEPFIVGGHKWRIVYSPNGYSPSFADCISLYLDLLDEDLEESAAVEAKYLLTFVEEVECQNPVYIRASETYSFSAKAPSRGSNRFIRRDALERSPYLRDNSFTIRCDIMVCNGGVSTSKDVSGGTLPGIKDHFNNLLQSKIGADVTFEVDGQMFAVHRCVLAAWSKVFRAKMFGPMATKGTPSSTVIQIKDMEAKVFLALLRFIYTDSFPRMDIEKNIDKEKAEVVKREEDVEYVLWLQGLFVAAVRYDLQPLKFVCENNMSELLCESSVASTLALAEQHHSHRLKQACFKFIQVQSPECLDKVMATNGWKHITTTYPSILKEIIFKLASNQKGKRRRKR